MSTELEKAAEEYAWAVSDSGFNYEVYKAYIDSARMIREKCARYVERSWNNERYREIPITQVLDLVAHDLTCIGEDEF